MFVALERSPKSERLIGPSSAWSRLNHFTQCLQTNRAHQRCKTPPNKFSNANTSLRMSNGRPRTGVLRLEHALWWHMHLVPNAIKN